MTNVKPVKHIHSIGLDYLEIYATFIDEAIFEGVDFDNSNQVFYGEYSCTKVTCRGFQYQVLFNKNNINIFSYFKGDKTVKIPTMDYVSFYGLCFRTEGKDGIVDILYSHFRSGENYKLRRFDICADFLVSIDTILGKFKPIEQKGANFYGKKGEIETLYIGEKKNSQNRRSIIRIYNKKADILAKGKNIYYQDYIIKDHVTRIEIEIRRDLAKNYTLEELYVDENLIGLLKNYFRKHTEIFEEYVIPKISLYRKSKAIDYEIIQAYGQSLMRVRMFLGHARGLLERGLCPVYALLDKVIIHEKTFTVLIESGDFIQIMRTIKIQAENWKEIMDAIKDKDYDTNQGK